MDIAFFVLASILLCLCIALTGAFAFHEFRDSDERQKVWLAEHKANLELYEALLCELRKPK